MAKQNFWERQKIQRGRCPGAIKKNGCSGRGAPRVFLAPILKAEIFDFKERRTSDNTQSQSLARRKIPKYSMKSQSAFLGTS